MARRVIPCQDDISCHRGKRDTVVDVLGLGRTGRTGVAAADALAEDGAAPLPVDVEGGRR